MRHHLWTVERAEGATKWNVRDVSRHENINATLLANKDTALSYALEQVDNRRLRVIGVVPIDEKIGLVLVGD